MADNRIFELRTYRSSPHKLAPLEARFRDHTLALFAEHGIEVVGFWSAPDADDATTGTLVYICAFPDRAAAQVSWEAFRADPRWIAARSASETDGPLNERIESLFMSPTDFSAIR